MWRCSSVTEATDQAQQPWRRTQYSANDRHGLTSSRVPRQAPSSARGARDSHAASLSRAPRRPFRNHFDTSNNEASRSVR